MTSLGFAGISKEDAATKIAYLEQLPMIANCVDFETFTNEFELISRTILPRGSPDLETIGRSFPEVFKALGHENGLNFIYKVGPRICTAGRDPYRVNFLDVVETVLSSVDRTMEFDGYMRPAISEGNDFAIWRLARWTVLFPDETVYENTMADLFNGNDVVKACGALAIMKRDLAEVCMRTALAFGVDSVLLPVIDAMEVHNIEISKFAEMCFLKGRIPAVLSRIARFPPHLWSKDLVSVLLADTTGLCRASVCKAALGAPFSAEMLPKLAEMGFAGCEINDVNFDAIKKTNPVPWDALSAILRESKELITDATVDGIMQLDLNKILYGLVFPRMNEGKSWRVRFNAVKILSRIVQNIGENRSDMYMDEYTGFLIAMCMDHVYAVRDAAFQILEYFPDGGGLESIFISLFSMADDPTDEPQLIIIRQLLKTARRAILRSTERKTVESIMRIVGMSDPNYFDAV